MVMRAKNNLIQAQHSQKKRFCSLGFTLLEVVLAVTIAIGIMVIALYFYQQSSTLRKEALEEMDRITAVRLVMDRLSSELRCAVAGSGLLTGVSGSASSIEFVRLDPPLRGGLLTNESGELARVRMQPTFKKTSYRVAPDPVGGLSVLERVEEAILLGPKESSTSSSSTQRRGESNAGERGRRSGNSTNSVESAFDIPDIFSQVSEDDAPSSSNANTNLLFAGDEYWAGNDELQQSSGFMAMEGLIDEGLPQEEKIAINNIFARGIGYFNLRYYDGAQWVNSWNSKELPVGIEIRMAAEDPETEEARAARQAEEESDVFERAFSDDGIDGGEAFPLSNGSQQSAPGAMGIEFMGQVSSDFDTNVVVFQRIIYLPNARRQPASQESFSGLSLEPLDIGAGTVNQRRGR